MGSFDEVHGPDGVRPHYRALMTRLAEIGDAELADRLGLLDSFFRTLGITFAVTGHEGGLERTWPMDLVPRIIPADEWSHIEAGLVQRVTVLNRFLDDLYVGGQEAINDGIVPRWLVESAEGYVREAHGIPAPAAHDVWSPESTSSATTKACIGCSRTTCGCRAGSPTSWRTGWR